MFIIVQITSKLTLTTRNQLNIIQILYILKFTSPSIFLYLISMFMSDKTDVSNDVYELNSIVPDQLEGSFGEHSTQKKL